MTGRLTSPTSTRLTHGPSAATIETTAPKDNGGDGSRFSPTDLLAASLGSCAATTLSLFATRNGIPVDEVRFSVEKVMSASPRRVGTLVVKIAVASPCSDADFERLVAAGRSCPVRLSLHPDVVVEESYERLVPAAEAGAAAATSA